jgi:transposase-like protein
VSALRPRDRNVCVRWYLSYKLSYRDLVAMMGERSIGVAHMTILRWVQHDSPELERRWNRYARSVGSSSTTATWLRPKRFYAKR